MSPAIEAAPLLVYQLHVLLLRISPAIWRRILVPSNTSVAQLHAILQITIGWSDSQPYRFVLHGQQYSHPQPTSRRIVTNAEQTLLSAWRLRPKERLLYTYGLLDSWPLQLRLEKVLPYEDNINYPCCSSGAGQAPPEYCFGPTGFMDLRLCNTRERADKRLWEIITLCREQPEQIDNHKAEVRRLCYWLEQDHFDRQATNILLQQQTTGIYSWPGADRELSKCRLK